ncbi:hypothetical protein YC2023_051172 [Brassica napus]
MSEKCGFLCFKDLYGLAIKKTVTIQPANKEQGVVFATTRFVTKSFFTGSWALKEYKHYILAGGLTGRIRVFDCEELTEHMLSWKPFRINQFDRGVLKPVYTLSNAARAHIHFFQRQIFSVQLWCRKMCESDVTTR